ncbi:MAG: M1 family metallopeptidase [Firmicutes bacterium]|nr:M1 family metallopeptidase [Bacillota bacterium]
MFKRKRVVFLLAIIMIFTMLVACGTKEPAEIEKSDNTKDEETIETSKENNTLLVDDYNGLDKDKINQYNIDIDFNPDKKTYKGKQTIKYINNEDTDFSEVYLHLYPNAFKEKATSPVSLSDNAYTNGFKPGYMDVKKVTVNGNEVENSTMGSGNTILKISLNESLKQGESIDIYMEYEVLMPPVKDRFGYGEKTFNFGNWYPIMAVYDEDGWNLDPYYRLGDPFYSDTSNYNVTITAPKDIIIASSGNILSENVKDNKKKWTIEAKLMRDFAWVASKHFIVESKDVDGTLVKNYFLKEDKVNSFAATAAYDSIEVFNKTFGKYPYGQYSVVATSFPTGMEYPGLVFIGEEIYTNRKKDWLRTVIVHETGHQWWYSVVGNDEIDEAWLDESLTTYSETIFYDEKYNDEAGENYFTNHTLRYYNTQIDRKQIKNDEVVVKPLKEFRNWGDYGALAYNKGAIFLHEIEKEYGEDTLYDIYREYYKKNKFLIANTNDFLSICEDVIGEDIDNLSDKWLYGKQ